MKWDAVGIEMLVGGGGVLGALNNNKIHLKNVKQNPWIHEPFIEWI